MKSLVSLTMSLVLLCSIYVINGRVCSVCFSGDGRVVNIWCN